MYGDGNRQTISELQRAAAAMRSRIFSETAQLAQVQKEIVKAQQHVDQLGYIFLRDVEEDARVALMRTLSSISEEIDLTDVPLIPITIALANGHLSNAKHLHAVRSRFVNDNSISFLAHVLQFSTAIVQVQSLDISETKVTEKGLYFLLKMMAEREAPFNLIVKNRVPPEVPATEDYKRKFQDALEKLTPKQNCVVIL